MALESDTQNADGSLAVMFYKNVEQDVVATAAEGRPICKEVDYIKIQVPGLALSEWDRPVEESDKNRFPIQWAKFLNRTNEDGNYEGTPIGDWKLISRSQAEQLRALKFYTVEAVAQAGDQHIQNIGMVAGMSPYAFRDKAKHYLESAKTEADFVHREEEIDQLREENAKLRLETEAMMQKMRAENEALRAENDARFATLLAAVGEKKPRARKKAETVEE